MVDSVTRALYGHHHIERTNTAPTLAENLRLGPGADRRLVIYGFQDVADTDSSTVHLNYTNGSGVASSLEWTAQKGAIVGLPANKLIFTDWNTGVNFDTTATGSVHQIDFEYGIDSRLA